MHSTSATIEMGGMGRSGLREDSERNLTVNVNLIVN